MNSWNKTSAYQISCAALMFRLLYWGRGSFIESAESGLTQKVLNIKLTEYLSCQRICLSRRARGWWLYYIIWLFSLLRPPLSSIFFQMHERLWNLWWKDRQLTVIATNIAEQQVTRPVLLSFLALPPSHSHQDLSCVLPTCYCLRYDRPKHLSGLVSMLP